MLVQSVYDTTRRKTNFFKASTVACWTTDNIILLMHSRDAATPETHLTATNGDISVIPPSSGEEEEEEEGRAESETMLVLDNEDKSGGIFRMLRKNQNVDEELHLVKSNVLRALTPESDSDDEMAVDRFGQEGLGPNGVFHEKLSGFPKFSGGCWKASRDFEEWLRKLGLMEGGVFPEGYELLFAAGTTPTQDNPASTGAFMGIREFEATGAEDDTDMSPRNSRKKELLTSNTPPERQVHLATPKLEVDDDSYDDEDSDEDYVPKEIDDEYSEDDSDDDDWQEEKAFVPASETRKKRERPGDSDTSSAGNGSDLESGAPLGRKRLKVLEENADISFPFLDLPFYPRIGEVGWYPTNKLRLNLGMEGKVPLWPVLVVTEPASTSTSLNANATASAETFNVIPLPLPSASEINFLLKQLHLSSPPEPSPLGSNDVDSRITPGHCTPVIAPTRYPIAESTPSFAVAAATSHEILEMWPGGVAGLPSVFAATPGEKYVKAVRWGGEVVKLGDVVQLASVVVSPEETVIEEVVEGEILPHETSEAHKAVFLRKVVKPAIYSFSAMELTHIILLESGRLEIEGRLFQLTEVGEIQSCLGLARYRAHKVLVGRWLGMPKRLLANVSVAPQVDRPWEGWIGSDIRYVEAVETICGKEGNTMASDEEEEEEEEEEDEEVEMDDDSEAVDDSEEDVG
ncbi:hypothetical protein BC829DRAFT_489665 [Chytridium lagenaria]|nr:hypothetical protein BC829DRAFT_489665 [Chytridium lagenaria]